ncbi:preprotein translocase SecE subunit [Aeropyrum pernix K1]|uniref:Protein translocase subunit SecE n=2 Tax=Aeropyrum pernix TaxID=56636 RepID=SECE_AERPE|nr:protein translocase SEC61 complex subunit gamma [Aeropyrum pernix]P58198.2 RecName: Full=Protein translocase subunit SecE; AltName: Full=Protein transport protein Sec61 gamma subunit homolog [Aeropyrum pernix K1]BAF34821.1 preprotein translocase SecE subunit [Aeropyrum pernix K1]GBF08797.1 protein translocase subunit SecE [Aeropyrum pernix]
MGIVDIAREYIVAWRRILTLARKPDEEEYSLLLKLNLLGFALVGGIGYLIHLGYIILTSG